MQHGPLSSAACGATAVDQLVQFAVWVMELQSIDTDASDFGHPGLWAAEVVKTNAWVGQDTLITFLVDPSTCSVVGPS